MRYFDLANTNIIFLFSLPFCHMSEYTAEPLPTVVPTTVAPITSAAPTYVTTYDCINRYTKTGCCSGTVYISSSITRIENNAFHGCSAMKRAIIPSTIREIGFYAFSSCSDLDEVVIPSSVVNMYSGIFQWCNNLRRVVLPTSISNIPDAMFRSCSNLKSISLPSSITSIGSNAFRYSGLQSIGLPSSLTRIQEYAFQSSQLRNLTLPSSLRVLENNAFSDCWSLQSIVVLSSAISSISSVSFSGSTCSSASHVVYLPAPNLYDGSFDSCTVLVMAPTQGMMDV